MKVKTISRSADTYVPARNTQELAMPRNLNPALHPFERAREYTRAVTATKLERMFAQPFVGQMGDGHRDGIYCISKNFQTTNQVASGSGDGVVKYWNMSSRDEAVSFRAHFGMVTGLAVTPRRGLLSCGDDKSIKLWSLQTGDFGETDDLDVYRKSGNTTGLLKTFSGEHAFQGLDHHFTDDTFVTGGAAIQLWNMSRTNYVSNLSWGADNVTRVKFNKTETNVLASCGSDNSIVLYDIRTNTPVQKVVTALRPNSLAWNPMEAYTFASGHDDHNAYLWDMRDLSKSLNVYKDHVSAVTDLDFSPTGKELVTGSYDKTIRIFRTREGHSREIYHTKRMQRVFAVAYTTDARYILSGSDDANLRLWRANALERLNVKSARERSKLNYDNKLKERYKYMPEVRRISRHRHLPSVVKKAQEIKRVETESLKRREENDRMNRKDGSRPRVPERQKHIRGTAWKESS